MTDTDIVTGAFGYTGRYLSTRLLAAGRQVRTLTNHPRTDHPLSGQVEALPFTFDDHDALVTAMRGCTTFYNTYWTRYRHAGTTHGDAVSHTKALLDAALEAGIERFVHVSITNPSATSFYEYYRGKAAVEELVRNSGLSYAIVRPTVLFGDDDILINDIAWLVRHFPIFTIPGDGRYKLRPVATGDLADLMILLGLDRENRIVDAVGPERYTFADLVRLIARTVDTRCLTVNTPPRLVEPFLAILGRITGDVVLTRDEIDGLMAGYIDVEGLATFPTRLSEYLTANADRIGRRYQSELARR